MTFEELEHVRIKDLNVTGIIINAYVDPNGNPRYTVESDTEEPIDDPDAWNDVGFPQLICDEDRLERI